MQMRIRRVREPVILLTRQFFFSFWDPSRAVSAALAPGRATPPAATTGTIPRVFAAVAIVNIPPTIVSPAVPGWPGIPRRGKPNGFERLSQPQRVRPWLVAARRLLQRAEHPAQGPDFE